VNCQTERAGFGVSLHTDTEIQFRALPGIGVNKAVRVTIVDPFDAVVAQSDPVRWSYDPPRITEIRPNILRVKQHPWLDTETATIMAPRGTAVDDLAAQDEDKLIQRSSRLTIAGRNFGPLDTRDWTDQERVLNVWVDGRPCHNPVRSLDTRGSLLDDSGEL